MFLWTLGTSTRRDHNSVRDKAEPLVNNVGDFAPVWGEKPLSLLLMTSLRERVRFSMKHLKNR